jgi:RNase adaptor protein for sRNA GlmZ degradation
MPVMLQSCGKPTKRRVWLKGPDAPAEAVVLNCTTLPNPYKHLDAYRDASGAELDAAKRFLQAEAKAKLDALVARGRAAVEAGRPVVAQCAFGKHRSRAVLELVAEGFDASRVYVVHREA